MRTKVAFGAPIVQFVLMAAHWFLWHTWERMVGPVDGAVKAALLVLSLTFFPVTALSFRFHNYLVRALYLLTVLWLGVLNFLFWAACLAWAAEGLLTLAGQQHLSAFVAQSLLAVALLVSAAGIINARWIRLVDHKIQLENLPANWRGKRIALVTDAHLGSINGLWFSRQIVSLLESVKPDLVLIAGDLFDGSGIDPERAMTPWKQLNPPFGICFATGNHEEYGDRTPFLRAIHGVGIRILDPDDIPYLKRETDPEFINSSLVNLDGLQIAGIGYHDSTHTTRLTTTLESLKLDRNRPSILLNHVPNQLPVVERAGFSLMVSGHTHGGQIFPFTWITKRIFGSFTSGHSRFGSLQTLTSFGIGSWGPPMRVGTRSELPIITLI